MIQKGKTCAGQCLPRDNDVQHWTIELVATEEENLIFLGDPQERSGRGVKSIVWNGRSNVIMVRDDVNGDRGHGSNTIKRISTKNQLGLMGSKERVTGSWSGPKEDWIVRDDVVALMRFRRPSKKTCTKTSLTWMTEDGSKSGFPMGPDFG